MNDAPTVIPPTYPPQANYLDLYHPRGPKVRVAIYELDPARLLATVDGYLDAGWKVEAPGLEVGEERDTVGWVSRKTKDSRDGVSDVLILYADREGWTKGFLTVYLNNGQDREAFEFASRLKLKDIPEYVGEGKLERGKSAQTDRLIIRAPRPFGVIFGTNPKYNDDEAKRLRAAGQVYAVPKKRFLRWADQKPAAAEEPHTASRDESKLKPLTETDEKDWNDWLDRCSTPEKFTEARAGLEDVQNPWRDRLKAKLLERAKNCGCVWNGKVGQFELRMPS